MAQDQNLKERVNIFTEQIQGNSKVNKELPFPLLVVGDFLFRDDPTVIENRKPLSINKDNFNGVMKSQKLSLSFHIPNTLAEEGGDMPVNLKIQNIKDFHPESVIKQVPELNKVLEVRKGLQALKAPLSNKHNLKKIIENMLSDENLREQLKKEIAMLDQNKGGENNE